MQATVRDGRVVGLAPDPKHPVSRGYACAKGIRFVGRVQQHPRRLLEPRWQGRPVGWSDALQKIGARLRAVLDAHGPEAVGIYSGNAVGHQLGAVLGVAALQRGLGTTKHYSCLTLDNSEMFVVAERVFGSPLHTFVADYPLADEILLLGTDPLASQASQAQSQPRASAELRAQARQGRLTVVDPRVSVTARSAAVHLQPRVGSDVYLLAWLLQRALGRGRGGLGPNDAAALSLAVAGFSLTRAAEATGLPPHALEDLDRRLAVASRPLVWSGLGVLLGPQGTLGWWLTLCLQATLGGLGTVWRYQPSELDLPAWGRRLGLVGHDARVRSTVDGWPAIMGTLPAATLARDVLGDHRERLRALIVVGGDPLGALPQSARAREALDALDLLVCVDLFANATGALADAILPAATWLERDQLEIHTANQRPWSHLHHVSAVVPPSGQARPDWRILVDLCRAAGARPFASRLADGAEQLGLLEPVRLAKAVLWLSGIPSPLTRRPFGRSSHVPSRMPSGRFAVPEWCRALTTLPEAPEAGLRLLSSVRSLASMNHWLRSDRENIARIHVPDWPGTHGWLEGPGGRLRVRLVHDPSLAPDTVVLGFGDVRANPNHLVSDEDLEPFSGQPISNGTRVRLLPG